MGLKTLKNTVLIALITGAVALPVFATNSIQFNTSVSPDFIALGGNISAQSDKVPGLDSLTARLSVNNVIADSSYVRTGAMLDLFKRISIADDVSLSGRLTPFVTTISTNNNLEWSLDYDFGARVQNFNLRFADSTKEISYTQPLNFIHSKSTFTLTDKKISGSLDYKNNDISLSATENFPYEGKITTNLIGTIYSGNASVTTKVNFSDKFDSLIVRGGKTFEDGSMIFRFYLNPFSDAHSSGLMGSFNKGDFSASGKLVNQYGRKETELSATINHNGNSLELKRETNSEFPDLNFYKVSVSFKQSEDTTATIQVDTNKILGATITWSF